MANLTETSTFPAGIYQLETTDPVLGGPPNLGQGLGMTNVPIQQLANRTRFLRDAVMPAAVLDSIKGVDGAGSGLDADLLDGRQAASFVGVEAFGGSTRSLAANGYMILPNGVICQWGEGGPLVGPPGPRERLFPIAFPVSCLRVIPVDVALAETSGAAHIVSLLEFTATSFRYMVTGLTGGQFDSPIHWWAVGR